MPPLSHPAHVFFLFIPLLLLQQPVIQKAVAVATKKGVFLFCEP